MIECPFCSEVFEEDELIFEFNWGMVASFFYHRKKLNVEPSSEYRDRAFYVRLKYDLRGNPVLHTCSTVINPEKHPGIDPMRSVESGWNRVVQLLSEKKVFEVECDDDDRTLPVAAKILPIVKHSKTQHRHDHSAEGLSTAMFCPICEQQLTADVLKAKTEVRILLSGRPGSGKTVYATQVISELMQGRQTQGFSMEAANNAVNVHYAINKNRLKPFGNGFVLATNPGAVQEPYVYLLRKDNSSVRLVIQDIAGEDTENRTKYSAVVRKADMLMFFVDPWHIEEMRTFHKKNNDLSNAIVDRSTGGRYGDLNGIFLQMMSVVDRKFTDESGQLASVLLIKGDYLNPPMLSRGNQPECEMMRQPISFSNPENMEFSISMRSSFIRQCMHEWESTRGFTREVESKYSAHNVRYFVASALGQSTHLRQVSDGDSGSDGYNSEDPNAQFAVNRHTPRHAMYSDAWDYDEQVLESAARPENVIDPIFWCLKRKGFKF